MRLGRTRLSPGVITLKSMPAGGQIMSSANAQKRCCTDPLWLVLWAKAIPETPWEGHLLAASAYVFRDEPQRFASKIVAREYPLEHLSRQRHALPHPHTEHPLEGYAHPLARILPENIYFHLTRHLPNLTRTLLDLCRQCQATTLSGGPDGLDGEQLQLFLASSKGGIGYLPIAFGVGERPSLSTRRTSLFIAAWEPDILFWNAQPCHRSSKNLAFSAYPEPQTYL